jgi:hypothetical protein
MHELEHAKAVIVAPAVCVVGMQRRQRRKLLKFGADVVTGTSRPSGIEVPHLDALRLSEQK